MPTLSPRCFIVVLNVNPCPGSKFWIHPTSNLRLRMQFAAQKLGHFIQKETSKCKTVFWNQAVSRLRSCVVLLSGPAMLTIATLCAIEVKACWSCFQSLILLSSRRKNFHQSNSKKFGCISPPTGSGWQSPDANILGCQVTEMLQAV